MLNKSKAFTLVEILVALAVGAIIVGATYASYELVATQYKKNMDIADMHTSGRAIMRIIERDVRMAGFEYRDKDAKVTYGTISSPLTIKDSGDKCCDEVTVVYDYYDEEAKKAERIRIRYWVKAYKSNKGSRYRLYKQKDILGKNKVILANPTIGKEEVMADYIEDLQFSDANESLGGGQSSTDIHHKNNKYKWGGIGSECTMFCNNDWDKLVNESNTSFFCGLDNWRVPSNDEAISLIGRSHSTRAGRGIDLNYFPNTPKSASGKSFHNSTGWTWTKNLDNIYHAYGFNSVKTFNQYFSGNYTRGSQWPVYVRLVTSKYNNVKSSDKYTKLDSRGNNLPKSAKQWTCVRDNVHGLTWEVKTDSSNAAVKLVAINLTLRTKNQYGKDRQFKKKDYHGGNFKIDKTDKYKRDTFSSTVLVRNLAP